MATVSKNILEEFFDKKELSILKLFLFDDADQFYLREVSKKTKVPIATTWRIVKRFKQIGIVQETVIKKTKFYSLAKNKATIYLNEIFEEKKTIIDEFIETASKLPGVQAIIKHGEDQKDKVNLFVIGNEIDIKTIKEKVGEIKDKYNFSIIELVLSPDQFNQMSMTGLIPEKKEIIWEFSTTNV